jgi:hypothetical protein
VKHYHNAILKNDPFEKGADFHDKNKNKQKQGKVQQLFDEPNKNRIKDQVFIAQSGWRECLL